MATGKIWLIRGAICLAVAILVATLSPKVRELSASDRCLDQGGAYDYSAQACRFDNQVIAALPGPVFQLPDSRSTRHGKVAGVLLLAGFVLRDLRGRSGRTAQPGNL